MYGGLVRKQNVEERSALLASRGVASLALGYFGLPRLPKDYLNLGKHQADFKHQQYQSLSDWRSFI